MAGEAAAGAQGNTDSAAAAGAVGKTDEAAAAAGAAAAGAAGAAGKDGAAAKDDTGAAGAAGKTGEEGKGAGEQGKGGTADAAAAASKAPDKYSLAIPDDAKAFVDDLTVKEVERMGREAGWSNDDAQAALNEHAAMIKKADEAFLSQLKADADYGGDKLVETQRLARTAIDLVRPEGHPRREAFMKAINRVAAGNHPEFVSFLADIGKRAAEDGGAGGTGASKAGQRSAEEVLYGKATK